jgi:toxin YhaV
LARGLRTAASCRRHLTGATRQEGTETTLTFFRFHAQAQVIVFAWVNDEDTKRAYEIADDAYRVFRRMLDSGRPPSDWGQLLAEARAKWERLGRLASGGARTGP